MKLLLRLSREAVRYKNLYILALLSTLGLTAVNLAAPRVLSAMTGLVERGMTEDAMSTILQLTAVLVAGGALVAAAIMSMMGGAPV